MTHPRFFIYLRHPRPNRSKICEICGKKEKQQRKNLRHLRNLRDKKKAPTTFVIEAFLIKEGGYLLSRIALQYHRRK